MRATGNHDKGWKNLTRRATRKDLGKAEECGEQCEQAKGKLGGLDREALYHGSVLSGDLN